MVFGVLRLGIITLTLQSNNLYFNFPNFCAFFLHFFGILTLFNTFTAFNHLLTLFL